MSLLFREHSEAQALPAGESPQSRQISKKKGEQYESSPRNAGPVEFEPTKAYATGQILWSETWDQRRYPLTPPVESPKPLPRPIHLKVTVTKGRPFGLVAIDWQLGQTDCSWISVSFHDTQEDVDRWEKLSGGAPAEFSRFVSYFIPSNCIVYAALGMNSDDIADMRHRLRELGFHYEDSENLRPHNLLRRIFVSRDEGYGVIYAAADKDFVVGAFDRYVDWMSDSWVLLISRNQLEDWARVLDRVTGRGRHLITRDILEKVDLFITNEQEHGFEILSSKRSYHQLEDMVREAATGLDWTVEAT